MRPNKTDRILGPRRPFEERYWEKVNKAGAGGCWLWIGCCNTDGYGKIYLDWKMRSAHHFPWMWSGKEVPTFPHVLDHICKVRNCVNPEHLRVVTQADNCTLLASDGSPFARNRKATKCKHGHPFAGENLAVYRGPSGIVTRVCLTCNPQYWRWAVVPRTPPPGARKPISKLLNQDCSRK